MFLDEFDNILVHLFLGLVYVAWNIDDGVYSAVVAEEVEQVRNVAASFSIGDGLELIQRGRRLHAHQVD